MSASIFISYSRADASETDWLARLRMYLAPYGRQGLVDPWDDGKIGPGMVWRPEIQKALDRAAAAILLVGPGFLASNFVMEREIPVLLAAASRRGLKLFPLIVGFCGYQHTELGIYQTVNRLETPLESLPTAEQNRILNTLASDVVRIVRTAPTSGATTDSDDSLTEAMRSIDRYRSDCAAAFMAQAARRDDLVSAIEHRLQIRNDLEYEKFFFRQFSGLTPEERFEFDQIRVMTEGPIQLGNRKMLEIIESDNRVISVFPEMAALRQHLVFWLNKFDRIFVNNHAMCLLYTGVEDGVPFPGRFDEALSDWLRSRGSPA